MFVSALLENATNQRDRNHTVLLNISYLYFLSYCSHLSYSQEPIKYICDNEVIILKWANPVPTKRTQVQLWVRRFWTPVGSRNHSFVSILNITHKSSQCYCNCSCVVVAKTPKTSMLWSKLCCEYFFKPWSQCVSECWWLV